MDSSHFVYIFVCFYICGVRSLFGSFPNCVKCHTLLPYLWKTRTRNADHIQWKPIPPREGANLLQKIWHVPSHRPEGSHLFPQLSEGTLAFNTTGSRNVWLNISLDSVNHDRVYSVYTFVYFIPSMPFRFTSCEFWANRLLLLLLLLFLAASLSYLQAGRMVPLSFCNI